MHLSYNIRRSGQGSQHALPDGGCRGRRWLQRSALPLLLISLGFFQHAKGQDFAEESFDLFGYRSLGPTVLLQQFRPRPGNSRPDSDRIDFSKPMYGLEYRQSGLRITVGYGPYTVAGFSRSSFSIEGESAYELPLSGSHDRIGLFLPIVITTNYFSAGGLAGSSSDFQVASLGAGTGLAWRVTGRDVSWRFAAAAALQYASAGFSINYGTSTLLSGEAQFLVSGVIGDGMTFGYRAQSQQWMMNTADLDFQRFYQGIFLGIFF